MKKKIQLWGMVDNYIILIPLPFLIHIKWYMILDMYIKYTYIYIYIYIYIYTNKFGIYIIYIDRDRDRDILCVCACVCVCVCIHTHKPITWGAKFHIVVLILS